MKLGVIFTIILLITGCSEKAEEYVDFKMAFKYSTDVGHFKFIKEIDWKVNGKQCTYPVRRYEVIKSFKGGLKSGEFIDLHGDVDSYENMEKERILFITKTTSEDTFSTDECDIQMFNQFKSISMSCCLVIPNELGNNKAVIFYEMLNSEQRGPDIPLPMESVYKTLTKYGD